MVSRMYINNSPHFVWTYAWIFVCKHYLFREENSFPGAKVEENGELWGTDNVQHQINIWHIFIPMEAIAFIILQIFIATQKLGNITHIFPSLSWGIFSHVACLDQLLGAIENIWWIISFNTLYDWLSLQVGNTSKILQCDCLPEFSSSQAFVKQGLICKCGNHLASSKWFLYFLVYSFTQLTLRKVKDFKLDLLRTCGVTINRILD